MQVPVFMVVGSGATAYLAQLGLKLIIDNWGTTLIFKGTNYLSLYIFIILIQIIFNYNKIFMSHIFGNSSATTQLGDVEFRFCILVGLVWVSNC